jgi:hypothetical protein
MAGKMISELSDAITLQSTDLIPLARGALTLRIAGSAIGASTIISDTPLTGVSNGQLWFDSSSGITSIYYDSTWVDVGGGDSANSLNVVDSPTIDLSYNSSTGTLSAGVLSVDSFFTGAGIQSLGANGYQKLPGGLIVQWGVYSTLVTTQTPVTINLPFTFPNSNLAAIAIARNNTGSDQFDIAAQIISKTTTSITLFPQWMGNGLITCNGFEWLVLGY